MGKKMENEMEAIICIYIYIYLCRDYMVVPLNGRGYWDSKKLPLTLGNPPHVSDSRIYGRLAMY